MKGAWVLCLAMAAPCGHAAVYAHVDPLSGMTILNNVPPTGAAESASRTVASAQVTRVFPVVSSAQQTQRDAARREILQTELHSEQQALDTARAGRADSDVVARHATNVAALKRELAGVR